MKGALHLAEQTLMLLNHKKYTKAISLANYTKGEERGVYNEVCYAVLGEIYFYTNRYEESIDAFKKAISNYESHKGYYIAGHILEPFQYNLWIGACYEALGKEEEAITYYERSAKYGRSDETKNEAKKRLEELEAKQAKKQEEERKRIETEKIEAAKNACHLSDFLLANPEQNNQTMLIPVSSGNKYGYINTKGEYIIAPQFDGADMFSDGLALVRSADGKYGYISENGKYVIQAKFKRASPFVDGLAFAITDDEEIICINKKGKKQCKLQQEVYEVHGFSEGLAHFRNTDDNYGYIDKTGKVVIAPQYDAARPFRNGLAAVSVRGEKGWGFVNQTGETVIKPQFAFVRDFSENKAAVCKEGDKLVGFIDKNGKYIINPQFNFAGNFSEGMANVLIGEKWGFINENGEILIKPQFDDAQPFKNGLAKICFGEKWGLIDKTGKVIVGTKWCCSDVISNLYGGIIFARDENSENDWRIIDGNCNFLDLKFGLIPEVLYEHWVETDMMNMPPEYYSPWVGKY
jgi:tetratricopeptide (TPR) repeat protein